MPLISVVTPVYNGEKYLRSCIESVLNQTLSDWEYIIADNCSTDDSRKIAESYAGDRRIRVYSYKTFVPVVSSFNRSATLVSPTSRYLKFVCADDLLFRNCLELMVAVAESNPNIAVVGSYNIVGRTAVCEGPDFPNEAMPGKQACKWFFQGRLGILGSPTAHMIRLPADGINGNLFDTDFRYHSDIELFVRMLKSGKELGFVHQVLAFIREHAESLSATQSHVLGTGFLESLAMLTKHGPGFLSMKELRELTRAHRRAYGQFLFLSLLKRTRKTVWRYHRVNWKSLGIATDWFHVARRVVEGFVMCAVHPWKTLNRLTQRRVRSSLQRRLAARLTT